MRRHSIAAALAAIVITAAGPAAAAGLNAPICGKCHQEDSNKMMGFLKDVSFKAGTILMDLLDHRELVYFDDDTRVKNLKSLEEMRKYRGKGFRIYFAEEDGKKVAVHITRFDILQLVDESDRLGFAAVKSLMASGKKVVLVDVRPPKLFRAGHIPGAVNVPAPAFEKFKKNLPADRKTTLVVYGVGGCLSPSVAVGAMAEGFSDVRVYTAGYPDWARREPVLTTPGFVAAAVAGNHLVLLDVRSADEFARGHIRGAVSAPLAAIGAVRAKLPEKKNTPVVVFGPEREKAAREIISWGYRGVAMLPGSLDDWRKSGGAVASGPWDGRIVFVPRPRPGVIGVDDFRKALGSGAVIVDVRNPDEFEAGHLPGAVNIPLEDLSDRMASLKKDRDYILYCNTGSRAEMAYSQLANHGFSASYLDALVKFSSGGYEIEEK